MEACWLLSRLGAQCCIHGARLGILFDTCKESLNPVRHTLRYSLKEEQKKFWALKQVLWEQAMKARTTSNEIDLKQCYHTAVQLVKARDRLMEIAHLELQTKELQQRRLRAIENEVELAQELINLRGAIHQIAPDNGTDKKLTWVIKQCQAKDRTGRVACCIYRSGNCYVVERRRVAKLEDGNDTRIVSDTELAPFYKEVGLLLPTRSDADAKL